MALDRRHVRAAAVCALLVSFPAFGHAALMTLTDTETTSVNAPVWLALSPNGDSLYVVNGNDTVSVYDVAAGVLTQTQVVSGGGSCDSNALKSVTSVVVSPDGSHVYMTSATNP